MNRGSALSVLAITRSAEFGDRINAMFAAMDDVRVDSRVGDLQSINGAAVAALERADVLLVDVDANDERELRQLGRIVEQRRDGTAILATAQDLSAQGVRGLIRQGVDDFIPSPSSFPTCATRSRRRVPSCSGRVPIAGRAGSSP